MKFFLEAPLRSCVSGRIREKHGVSSAEFDDGLRGSVAAVILVRAID